MKPPSKETSCQIVTDRNFGDTFTLKSTRDSLKYIKNHTKYPKLTRSLNRLLLVAISLTLTKGRTDITAPFTPTLHLLLTGLKHL